MEHAFTTSKGVHIGRLWVNRCQARPIDDPDMQILQMALVLKPAQVKQRKVRFIAYWTVAAVSLLLILFAAMYKPLAHAAETHTLQFNTPPKKYLEDPKYWFLKINKHHKEVIDSVNGADK